MKTLIGIMSCSRYLERRNQIRDTWMSWVSKLNPEVDVLFFTGTEMCLLDDCVGDIVHLDCPDTYKELPQKTYKLVEYAAAHNYDLLLKLDDDTYLLPMPEYLAEFSKHTCMGSLRLRPAHNDFKSYAQGGCYSLNKEAMQAVVNSPDLFAVGLEDGSVGKALDRAQLSITHSARIKTDYRHGAPCMGNDIISAHCCTPEMLNTIHQRNVLPLLSAYNSTLPPQPEVSNVRQITPLKFVPVRSDSITIAITSCNRHDLLRRTMESLASTSIDAPIHETIILEDSDAKKPDWLLEFRGLGPIRWISNGKRCGQWMSIDRLYDQISTEFIFHSEDDWEYDGRPFMAASMGILKNHPKILQVSIRGNNNTSGHPNVEDPAYADFKVQEPYWRQWWGGFSGNPGLRRLSDWKRIRSYGHITGYGQGGIAPEQTLSKLYLDLGYRIAVLHTPAPYIKHIGERRSKSIEQLPPRPRILIAIPACFKYEYGQHAKDLRAGITRKTEGRTAALRETWIKDIAPFSDFVDYKFFFGQPPDSKLRSQSDEVFLPKIPDDYHNLPFKMQAIYRWALQHRYDYVVKADDDTFLYIDRLMRSGFENHDQMGFFRCQCKNATACRDYITGMCYTLSKRALSFAANERPEHWAEDCSTGMILRRHRIRPVGHPGWLPGFSDHFVDIDKLPADHKYIALHAVSPSAMRELYVR